MIPIVLNITQQSVDVKPDGISTRSKVTSVDKDSVGVLVARVGTDFADPMKGTKPMTGLGSYW